MKIDLFLENFPENPCRKITPFVASTLGDMVADNLETLAFMPRVVQEATATGWETRRLHGNLDSQLHTVPDHTQEM
jgi:hypothetical protein